MIVIRSGKRAGSVGAVSRGQGMMKYEKRLKGYSERHIERKGFASNGRV